MDIEYAKSASDFLNAIAHNNDVQVQVSTTGKGIIVNLPTGHVGRRFKYYMQGETLLCDLLDVRGNLLKSTNFDMNTGCFNFGSTVLYKNEKTPTEVVSIFSGKSLDEL